jgi:hypothetical protein
MTPPKSRVPPIDLDKKVRPAFSVGSNGHRVRPDRRQRINRNQATNDAATVVLRQSSPDPGQACRLPGNGAVPCRGRDGPGGRLFGAAAPLRAEGSFPALLDGLGPQPRSSPRVGHRHERGAARDVLHDRARFQAGPPQPGPAHEPLAGGLCPAHRSASAIALAANRTPGAFCVGPADQAGASSAEPTPARRIGVSSGSLTQPGSWPFRAWLDVASVSARGLLQNGCAQPTARGGPAPRPVPPPAIYGLPLPAASRAPAASMSPRTGYDERDVTLSDGEDQGNARVAADRVHDVRPAWRVTASERDIMACPEPLRVLRDDEVRTVIRVPQVLLRGCFMGGFWPESPLLLAVSPRVQGDSRSDDPQDLQAR